jgi:hypothetical protein
VNAGPSSASVWAHIVEAYETREFFLFYVSTSWASLLPKRVIPQEDLPRLRAAILQWVGERANLAN